MSDNSTFVQDNYSHALHVLLETNMYSSKQYHVVSKFSNHSNIKLSIYNICHYFKHVQYGAKYHKE